MINAYIVYSALREMRFSKHEAWKRLGIYAGDDGLTPNIASLKESIESVSKTLGLDVKIATHYPNEPVPFLGRILVAPLTSDDSFQDPKRTIPKLHISTNKTIPVEQAAFNKAAGYMVTDHKTPIISHWASKVIELSKLGAVKNMTADEAWKLTATNAWPQRDGDLITSVFCKVMDWSQDELLRMVEQLQAVTGEFPLQMPIVYENTSDHPDKLESIVGEGVCTTTGNRAIHTEIPCLTTEKPKPTKSWPTPTSQRCGGHTSAKPLTKQSCYGCKGTGQKTRATQPSKSSKEPMTISAPSCTLDSQSGSGATNQPQQIPRKRPPRVRKRNCNKKSATKVE